MEERRFGRTGRTIGAIGFGAWAIGADWGTVDDDESLRALHAAADAGVTLFDTADVYGDGRSERLIGRFLHERRDPRLFVATKMGRRVPQEMANYTPEAFRTWIDRSRTNLGVERLDLVQLHCPPTQLYYRPDLFAALDELTRAEMRVLVNRLVEGKGVTTVLVTHSISEAVALHLGLPPPLGQVEGRREPLLAGSVEEARVGRDRRHRTARLLVALHRAVGQPKCECGVGVNRIAFFRKYSLGNAVVIRRFNGLDVVLTLAPHGAGGFTTGVWENDVLEFLGRYLSAPR